MKKLSIIFSLTFGVLSIHLSAQISEGGMPFSYQQNLKSLTQVPTVELREINIDSLIQNDRITGIPSRYGIVEDLDVNLKNGIETITDSGKYWRYRVIAPSAYSLKLFFSDFHIPEGAQLFVYNHDYSTIYGAYTHCNVNPEFSFVVADFPGSELYIEYYEPNKASFEGIARIKQISKAYRNLSELISENTEDSSYDDVNCGEGLNWQLEKHAVAKYTFMEEGYSYTCSGALINNENFDGTPYFLTAHHCVSTSDAAQTLTAYFNYESLGCGMMNKPNSQTLSGAELMTTGNKSDFTLLKLKTIPPPEYQPYYAGWDLNENPQSAVSIHHPEGFRKKISVEYHPPVSYNELIFWEDNSATPLNSHWEVYFDVGMTGSGSSGSPLFNENRRIIGQLHGGGDYDSYYGKISYSWNNSLKRSGRFDYTELAEYLSNDTSTLAIDGYYPPENLPEAIIGIENKYVCTGAPVTLTEYSVFDVNKWKWEISPATVSFIEGTSPTSQSPIVRFNAPDTYTIQLTVENAYGKDIRIYNDAILVGNNIKVAYETLEGNSMCLADADSLSVKALGASNYQWTFDNNSQEWFNFNNPDSQTIIITQKPGAYIDSTIHLTGIVTGIHGTCSDSSYFDIEIITASGDNIANAQHIIPGINGPFNNTCAGLEPNEPVPPAGECVSQNGWCDEFGTGDDYLANTVWFTFDGPESGAVSIAATGMDGQIALYEAYSYQNILDGNYTIVAANDDASLSDYTSFIKPIDVKKGQTYWIQFDGSQGNIQGDFYIELTEEKGTKIEINEQIDTPNLKIYPQPAKNDITVESSAFTNSNQARVAIYNQIGALIFSDNLSIVNRQITVNMANEWSNGIYHISIQTTEHESLSESFILKK